MLLTFSLADTKAREEQYFNNNNNSWKGVLNPPTL